MKFLASKEPKTPEEPKTSVCAPDGEKEPSQEQKTAQKTAVAEKEQAQEPEPEWQWGEGSEETMHPFWAVRRMTQKQLNQERINQPLGQIKKRFNCKLQTLSLSTVNIATVKGKCFNRTRLLDVPFLTNELALQKDEELILEINEPVAKKKPEKKRTWISAWKDEEKEAKK